MDLIGKNEKIFVYLILSAIIFLGFYLCFIGGYGSDEDTLPMIHVFEVIYRGLGYHTSRFTGNPIAELGIGFLSFYFGSFAFIASTILYTAGHMAVFFIVKLLIC